MTVVVNTERRNGRSRENPMGLSAAPMLPTTRRVWGKALVSKPIEIPGAGLWVLYDLDRVMGLDEHRSDLLSTLYDAAGRTSRQQAKLREGFADKWAGLVARRNGSTDSAAEQLETLRAILTEGDADTATRLANIKRYAGGVETGEPTTAEWDEYLDAQNANLDEVVALNREFAVVQRQMKLTLIADMVLGLGVPEQVEGGGETFKWPQDAGPRPDPEDSSKWDGVPDLILAWLVDGDGYKQAQGQVDSFLFGKASASISTPV